MKCASIVRYLATVVMLTCLSFVATPVTVAQTSTNTTQPTPSDLAKRVDDLERRLNELKAELAAQKPGETTASTPIPAQAPAEASAVVATTPAPTPSTLANILGPTTLSGFVDTYYGYNSNQPAGRQTVYRNFDIYSGQFSLNMLELVADKAVDKTSPIGYHIAFGFGQAENTVNSGELGFDQYLKEGYIEYLAPVGKGLQINLGKFVTPAGAEVIESKDNWNYSRGLLFSWAIPYFHYGVSTKYAFNDKLAVAGYLVNGWNGSIDNNSGKTGGFSLAWTPNKKVALTENFLFGPEQSNDNSDFRKLSDTVLTFNPTAKLSLMANVDYGHDAIPTVPSIAANWGGAALYAKYAPNDKHAFAIRGEYFDDHEGFETGTAQNMGEFTATFQRTIAKSIISRVEFRRDISNQRVFPYHSGLPISDQNTVSVGVIYAFSSAN
jgi:Putative beta-barrel porin-2, OmpL-like. bbp2